MLDVDGCVSAQSRWDADNGYKETEVWFGLERRRMCYAPAVVDRINSWMERGLAEVWWATGWEQRAGFSLAPALGFYDFKVSDFLKEEVGRCLSEDKVIFERPIVWIDDDHNATQEYERADASREFLRWKWTPLNVREGLDELLPRGDRGAPLLCVKPDKGDWTVTPRSR